MNIKFGDGQTGFGPGVDIILDGDEVAGAIIDWVRSQGIEIGGPITVSVNGELCESGNIYLDPSGEITDFDGKVWSGKGDG